MKCWKTLAQYGRYQNKEKNSTIATQFSDTLVVSFKEDDPTQVLYLFDDIQDLVMRLVKKNIICRGAISYGKLIHTKDVIFGPALVDAYETESMAAMYPRVVLDRNIIDIGITRDRYYKEKDSAEKGLLSYLSLDTDGKYYIDYFEQCYFRKSTTELISYVNQLRQLILAGRRFQKPDLKVKYGWMKTKFNQMLDKFQTSEFVDGSGATKSEIRELNSIRKVG